MIPIIQPVFIKLSCLASIGIVGLLALANVGGDHYYDDGLDDLERQIRHGWPFTYAWRNRFIEPDGSAAPLGLWNPLDRVERFEWWAALADATIIAVVSGFSIFFICKTRCKNKTTRFRFSVLHLLIFMCWTSFAFLFWARIERRFHEQRTLIDIVKSKSGNVVLDSRLPDWASCILGTYISERFQFPKGLYFCGTDSEMNSICNSRDFASLRAIVIQSDDIGDLGLKDFPKLTRCDIVALRFLPNCGRDTLDIVFHMPQIRTLEVCGLQFTDKMVSELRPPPALEHLDMSGTSIGDRAAMRLTKCRALTTLHLSETNLTVEGLRAIASLPEIRYLTLSGTDIDDKSVEMLKKMPQLRTVNLSRTAITDGAIEDLKVSRPKLEVYRAAVSGSAPISR